MEPWQVWWVTASVAGRTALSIPKGVLSVPDRCMILWPPIAVVVLAYKGWWGLSTIVGLAQASKSNSSSIRLQVVSRCAVSDGESVNVGTVNGLRCAYSIQPISTGVHVPNGLPTNLSEVEAQCGVSHRRASC